MRYRTFGIMTFGFSALLGATLLAQTTREMETREYVRRNFEQLMKGANQYAQDTMDDFPVVTRLATQTALAEVVDPAMRAALGPILKNLEADDFATREAAQKKLADLGDEYAPALREAVGQAKDEEAKQRLLQALEGIAERLALNPRPISVDFKDASPADVAGGLSRAMGVKIAPYADSATAHAVTLKAEKKPFWEVIGALNERAAVDVKESTWERTFALDSNGVKPKVYANASVQGPFVFVPLALALSGDDVSTRTFTFTMHNAVDPRVRVLKQGGLKITEFRDDAGNSLLLDEPVATKFFNARGSSVFTTVTALKYPEKPGKKASLKGEMRYLVVTGAETLEVPDLAKVEKKPIELAGFKVTFTEAKVTNGTPSLLFTTSSPAGQALVSPAERRGDSAPAEFEVRDANDRYITTVQVTGGGGGMKWGGKDVFAEPLKGRFIVPTKVKEVTVPFEIKDMAMP